MLAIHAAEHGWLPDWMIRLGIQRRVGQRAQALAQGEDRLLEFVQSASLAPVALRTEAANQQHYEVPTELFELMLGPRMKYSACLFETPLTPLAEAELAMLGVTCERAALINGQSVLELGCGWGSLSLYMAERYPGSRIVAVSNSSTQCAFIEAQARSRGLTNLRVRVADMNDFAIEERFDRVVSVEMFEHMRNWRALLDRVRGWLHEDGRLFLHIFCHRHTAYPFALEDRGDWLARHFFAEGLMPTEALLERCATAFEIESRYEVNGCHYAQTLETWLQRLDDHRAEALAVLASTAGVPTPEVKMQRWRMFLLACAELFAYREGHEWFVLHALLRPRPPVVAAGEQTS